MGWGGVQKHGLRRVQKRRKFKKGWKQGGKKGATKKQREGKKPPGMVGGRPKGRCGGKDAFKGLLRQKKRQKRKKKKKKKTRWREKPALSNFLRAAKEIKGPGMGARVPPYPWNQSCGTTTGEETLAGDKSRSKSCVVKE